MSKSARQQLDRDGEPMEPAVRQFERSGRQLKLAVGQFKRSGLLLKRAVGQCERSGRLLKRAVCGVAAILAVGVLPLESLESLLSVQLMQPAYAWYDFGHEVVACIAWRQLRPETKARAMQLLEKNPYFQKWVDAVPADVSGDERNMWIFAQAATWADDIKKDRHYVADGAEKGNKPDGPQCAENLGYSDFKLHKYWHYNDTPFTSDHSKLPPYVEPNAQTQIRAFREVLGASGKSDDLKSYDLVWLLHLVGDVHQPLHCVTRVTSADLNGDKGGNDCKLKGAPDNLHSVWDGIVGDDRALKPAIEFAKTLPDLKTGASRKSDEKIWIKESYKLAKSAAYAKPVGKTNGPWQLTEAYKARARKIGLERVELAGARLANLLNSELK
ncbi:MAG: S1/P1 nuclease [Candidatus Melainabacteria bacterium]|nr:MAG: S1/P1 nuclease [Candidatus Melainabacteria bacterium]